MAAIEHANETSVLTTAVTIRRANGKVSIAIAVKITRRQ